MDIPEVFITVNELSIIFDGDPPVIAVDKLSFFLNRGETLAIVGESGSGKTLTALMLAGLLPQKAKNSGSIRICLLPGGQLVPLTSPTLKNLRGVGIGIVFQEPMNALNPLMRVGNQVREAITAHHKLAQNEAKRLTIDWLEKVKLPEPGKIYDRYPHQLSGGQKQRVMIAAAMVNSPSLLIADEPTTALDPTVRLEILQLIDSLRKETGAAVMLITHDLGQALAIADNILVLRKGKKIEYGPTDRVLHHPEQAYTRALLACRPTAAKKGNPLPDVEFILEQATDSGRKPETYPNAAVKLTSKNEFPVLEVTGLNIWYPENRTIVGKSEKYVKAVTGVSFHLDKGEILGLAGESGSGKSSLCAALVGLAPIHSGTIRLKEMEVGARGSFTWHRVRKQIQVVFQDPFASLNPRLTIREQLAAPLKTHRIVSSRLVYKEIVRLLDMVRLPAGAADRYPHEFSGGQRQRIVIARALSVRPDILLADECVASLDVSIQAQIINLLLELQKEMGLSILFISHDLAVVHYVADRIMIMKGGRIVESGTAEQVLTNPADPYTRTLAEASASRFGSTNSQVILPNFGPKRTQ